MRQAAAVAYLNIAKWNPVEYDVRKKGKRVEKVERNASSERPCLAQYFGYQAFLHQRQAWRSLKDDKCKPRYVHVLCK